MPTINIGTAGWEYKDWDGTFYPKSLNRKNHLKFYAKIFDLVEVNSTFYRMPKIETLENWKRKVPEEFKFIIKMWKKITHKITEEGLENKVTTFFHHMKGLKEKIYGYLMQFPPWFKFSENNLDILKELISMIPSENIYFFEFRDNSWFESSIAKLIKKAKIFFVTTYLADIHPYYPSNQKVYYFRLIGDRTIEKFNIVRRTQEETIKEMNSKIKQKLENSNVREIFIIVNNHFSGFAPETVNKLKKTWNLPTRTFSNQKKLSDFF